jgi:hypothetical protein
VRGKNIYVEKIIRFLVHLRPKIRKFCVVRTYANMDELLVTTIEVEKVLGEIWETPYEPLKDERDGESNEGNTSTKRQITLSIRH